MRDLILAMSISIDGFVCGLDGDVRWMFNGDVEAKEWKVKNARNAGLHIMGSRTFDGMAAFWPTSTDAFAPAMNEIPKAVFSRRGPEILKAINTKAALHDSSVSGGAGRFAQLQSGSESWAEAYVASGDLADEIAKLKAQAGEPIVAHGGASFARSLIAEGLIDQYFLMVHPVALGRGLPIFADLAVRRPLKLLSSKAFASGSVAQVYRPA